MEKILILFQISLVILFSTEISSLPSSTNNRNGNNLDFITKIQESRKMRQKMLDNFRNNLDQLSDEELRSLALEQLNLFDDYPTTAIYNNPLLKEMLATDKDKRNEDIPPGFIGVRGRRSFSTLKRMGPLAFYSSDSPMMFSAGSNQKKDNPNMYKDGFLGVRG